MNKQMTASEMGKKGGRNKALKMSKEERVAHAKKMLKARWENRSTTKSHTT